MSADAQVAASSEAISCIACRYDLVGLPAEGNCPECGASIAESRRVVEEFFGRHVTGEAREVGAAAIISRGLRVSSVAILGGGLGLAASMLLGEVGLLFCFLGTLVLVAGCASVVHGVLKMRRRGTRLATSSLVLFGFAATSFVIGLAVVFGRQGPNDYGFLFFLGAGLLLLASMTCGFSSVHWMVSAMVPSLAKVTRRLFFAALFGPIVLALTLLAFAVLLVIAIGGSVTFTPFVIVGVLLVADTLAVAIVFWRAADGLRLNQRPDR